MQHENSALKIKRYRQKILEYSTLQLTYSGKKVLE
jgi:hypothetical protein